MTPILRWGPCILVTLDILVICTLNSYRQGYEAGKKAASVITCSGTVIPVVVHPVDEERTNP